MVLAHQIAMENPLIRADMIVANEFYDLAMRYNVSGVPQTNINEDSGVVIGAVPEEHMLQELKKALQEVPILLSQ